MKLIIGNKNYSSWSMRPWLVLRHFDIPFEEIKISLYTETSAQEIRVHSPSGKVPCLVDGPVTVWDSLAISEYLAECFPEHGLWPKSPEARAYARAISAEMHAGFAELRQHMSMNIRRRLPGKGITPQVEKDIERISEIWTDCRRRFGASGEMLFGSFTIADAFYAPVALRFRTYGVKLSGEAAEYYESLLALSSVQQWLRDVDNETEVIDKFEV